MDENVFREKDVMPDDKMVADTLLSTYSQLEEIRHHLRQTIGQTREEWKFYGRKYGWGLKTFLKKRNLFFIGVYDGYFMITFVFGEKAYQALMGSDLSIRLKSELEGARKYAEGRGLTIEVRDSSALEEIKKLVQFKIEN